MKKILSLALAAMMLFSFCVSVTAVTDEKQRLGDINADGNIDTYDYLLATRAYFGTVKLSDSQKTAADVTLDGSIDTYDCLLIKRAYFGTYDIPENDGRRFNDLSELNKERCEILVLGNSFIYSSNIGDIMNELFSNNGKDCYVYAISRGYASVNTYVQDSEIMSDIRAGYYDAVFICGLYGTWELDPLSILDAACTQSGTKLVIFPAHNEDRVTIDAAERNFKKAYLLDWKAELDALIESGVSKWDLCVNDAHFHSTWTAGYVGAHMAYRAIYGEIPQNGVEYSHDQEMIDDILGDYVNTGIIPLN